MTAFADTHAVFHAPAIWEAERRVLFEEGWVAATTRDLVARVDAEVREPVAGATVAVRREADGLRATRTRDAVTTDLAVAVRGPCVFVCGGAAPPPLEEALGPDACALLDDVGVHAVGPVFEERQTIGGNWKLVVSGAIEDYHLPHVHGKSVNPWRRETAAPTLFPGGHSTYGTEAPIGPLPRVLHGLLAGREPCPPRFANHLVFPNLLLIRLWGLVHVTRFVPLAVDATARVTRVYTHTPLPPLLHPRRPVRAALAAITRRAMGITFREDRWIVEEAHAGTGTAQDLPRGPAHAEEARVEHLLAEVGRRLARAGG